MRSVSDKRATGTASERAKFQPLPALQALLLILFTTTAPSLSFTQQKQKKDIAYDIEVSAISLAVTVQNRAGKYINDLTREDFSIFENDEKKEINYFSQDFESPLSLTILLDVSGSMALQDKLKESKEGLRFLISYLLNARDEFSLLIFADGEVEVAVNFTNDTDAFFKILDTLEAYGQTALNDAVAVSPDFANRGNNEKRALLLITDGIENDSQFSPDQAVEVARRVDIPIYSIGYKIPLSDQFFKKYKHSATLTLSGIVDSIERFSRATGGDAFFVTRPNDLNAALRTIKRDLSHQYILGYTSYRDPKNEYRKIKVITSNKRHKVRAREGYYSGEKKGPR